MAAQGIRPKKALGQHFVFDENTLRRIARIAGVGPGGRVVEVGAGLGGLTAVLASTGARVVALEIDARLFPVLREVA
ncbi:MAG: rRNA adenine N-6-methyltransferase family protein, partial [Acidimicrobiales bacterium]